MINILELKFFNISIRRDNYIYGKKNFLAIYIQLQCKIFIYFCFILFYLLVNEKKLVVNACKGGTWCAQRHWLDQKETASLNPSLKKNQQPSLLHHLKSQFSSSIIFFFYSPLLMCFLIYICFFIIKIIYNNNNNSFF